MTPELQLARECALEAGRILREEYERGSVVKSDAGRDVKLEADVAAEKVILRRLREASPHPILSEEAGADAGFGQAGLQWAVDPLDGTYNFSRKIPLCCVSIGLCEGERPVVGVIHDFLAGITYEGVVGQGAWRNGQPIRVTEAADPVKSVLLTGFPAGREFGRDSLSGFVAQAQSYKKVRLLGSAALSLAWVAAGLADVYHEDGIHFWDVAAGMAIVEAGGGRWAVRPGGHRFQMEVFASGPRLTHPDHLTPNARRAGPGDPGQ